VLHHLTPPDYSRAATAAAALLLLLLLWCECEERGNGHCLFGLGFRIFLLSLGNAPNFV